MKAAFCKKCKFSLRACFISVTLIAIAAFGIREAALQNQRLSVSSEITLRLHLALLGILAAEDRSPNWRFSNVNDSDGKALSSWRYWTGHNVASYPADSKFAAPWDAAANSLNASSACIAYCIPRLSAATNDRSTTVFAVSGHGSALNTSAPLRISELDSSARDLVVLVEAAGSRVHWMEPGDYSIDNITVNRESKIGDWFAGILQDCVHVAFADGEVWCLSSDTPMLAIEPFLTVDGARRSDRNAMLERYRIGGRHKLDLHELNRYR
ncbi:hypothetical protein I41_37650 [Lacipirellula limnantheis]|uniref:DUF1559 domain-containing protein n=1 Tax=Lacipirellula limnantheis TaxID=2528024 RepID=A0A517U1T3_9BACT|nr:hypothetical protein I41_37650 [Lacipirellula limnantheis]